MTSIGGIVVLLLLLLFRLLPRVLTGTISSGPVQDTKNLKICPGRDQSGPRNRQVPFTQNQTPTHTTGLKTRVSPMVKDRDRWLARVAESRDWLNRAIVFVAFFWSMLSRSSYQPINLFSPDFDQIDTKLVHWKLSDQFLKSRSRWPRYWFLLYLLNQSTIYARFSLKLYKISPLKAFWPIFKK